MQIYFLVVLVCYPGVGAPVVSTSLPLVFSIQINGKIIAWQLKVKDFVYTLCHRI